MYQDPGFGEYRLSQTSGTGGQPALVTVPQAGSGNSGDKEVSPKIKKTLWNYSTYDDPYDVNTNLASALKLMEEDVKAGARRRCFYRSLAGMAQGQDKDIITGILNDVTNHDELFRRVYYEITNVFLPALSETRMEGPESYRAGLKKALMDAQETAAEYRRVLFAMRGGRHINILTEAVTDVLRHLPLLSYLYTNACSGRL